MKILVYTGFNNDNGYKEAGILSSKNKQEYASINGYDFFCRRNYRGYDRPISWFKIKEIIELLPKYDYIFWSDADAIITNYNILLEDIINSKVERIKNVKLSPKDVPISTEIPELLSEDYIIAYDEYSPCMGNFIIKNSTWSINFFNKIYSMTEFMNDPIWDNRAQDYLFYNFIEKNSHVKYVPKNMINSMIPDWKFGDFLIHFPATEHPRRVECIKKYLEKTIK